MSDSHSLIYQETTPICIVVVVFVSSVLISNTPTTFGITDTLYELWIIAVQIWI